jgi:2-iminobutanoate/2-iminopropanoate deaminase
VTVRTVHTDAAPAAIGPYSQATIGGGLLYTAGQIALDPATGLMVDGDVVAQARRVIANLDAVLRAAGSGWDRVLRVTVYLQDMGDFPRVNEVYAEAVGSARPARSTVQVSALPRGALVEIDLIAQVD